MNRTSGGSGRGRRPDESGRSSGRHREPEPEPEQDDVELDGLEVDGQGTLAQGFDPAEFLREQFKKTPWWLIAAAFHGLLLAITTVIPLERPEPKEEPVVQVGIQSKPRPKLQEIERPRGIFDRAGIPKPGEQSPTQEPAIFFPGAEESDHNESADGEDYQQMKGDSFDNLSYLPGQDKGTKGRGTTGAGHVDVMGVGGGSGAAGRYGGRFGGRKNLVARGGGTQATESAVLAGLRWLARHQSEDGSWKAEAFDNQCGGGFKCSGHGYAQFDAGLTGLSLLAFLGAGFTHLSRSSYEDPYTHKKISFGQCVRKGLDYLISVQDQEGCFGTRTGEFMYNHSIAALAMTEAYGLTNAAVYRVPAQKGIDFITVAQNPYLAWRYHVKPGENDTSVTGWCIMALKSAEISELTTSRTCFDGARAWLDRVTNKETGEVGYNGLGKVDVIVRGKNEDWISHPSMTAVGLLCRIYIDKNEGDAMLEKHAKLIVKDPPTWDETKAKEKTIDSYYWYYATLALFLYKDGAGAKYWKAWNESMKDALCNHQKIRKDGCADGSWDPALDRWGFAGGRVYMTAINVLTLEVYYRYESVFGARKGKEK